MFSQVGKVFYLANQFTSEYIKVCLFSWKLQITIDILNLIIMRVSKQC